jgi:hypothetical protein
MCAPSHLSSFDVGRFLKTPSRWFEAQSTFHTISAGSESCIAFWSRRIGPRALASSP